MLIPERIPFGVLNLIGAAACEDARAHGLWEPVEAVNEGHDRHACAVLIRDEADEALLASEDRGHYAEELADVIIMALSSAAYLNIDIAAEVNRKMEINKRRPWKHGREERSAEVAVSGAEKDENFTGAG